MFRLASPLLVLGLAVSCSPSHRKAEPGACVELNTGSSASLRGLSAVDGRVAWVAGSGGTVLRTVDAGDNWSPVAPSGAEDLDFRDVEAFDRESALLVSVASPARFFRTDDGGASWTEVHHDDREGVFFDSMAFWDNRRGLAFSDPVEGSFLVIATDDGGESWRQIPAAALPIPLPGEAGFAASGTSLAVAGERDAWFATGGAAGRVFRTSDGGATWTVAATPLRSGSPSQGIFSIAFRDTLRGVIVGGDYQSPGETLANAATSRDGGATWQAVESQPPRGYRSAVVWLGGPDSETLVATGPSGTDISSDGGRSWTPMNLKGHHSLDFAGGTLWAAGAGGAVARCSVDTAEPAHKDRR